MQKNCQDTLRFKTWISRICLLLRTNIFLFLVQIKNEKNEIQRIVEKKHTL